MKRNALKMAMGMGDPPTKSTTSTTPKVPKAVAEQIKKQGPVERIPVKMTIKSDTQPGRTTVKTGYTMPGQRLRSARPVVSESDYNKYYKLQLPD